MYISEMSIADVKASLDFIREFIKEMKQMAKDKEISVNEIAAYQESVDLESKLYDYLQNTVRMLN